MGAFRFTVALFALAVFACGSVAADGLFRVDYRDLVGRADLTYEGPTARSEEGLFVGNGRMGSLVWTTPTALKFQVNRVDVFRSNCGTNSFPERHSDYCNGCGFVDAVLSMWISSISGRTSFRKGVRHSVSLVMMRWWMLRVRASARRSLPGMSGT